MIQGKWFLQGEETAPALKIREAVFSRGRDRLDDLAQQVVVYQDGLPVGTARLWWAEGAFKLGDLCVLEAYRGKGFGDLLMRLCLHKALSHHARLVELTAPREAEPFFAQYGFTQVSPPMEGETHVSMALQGEKINLSHCGASCGGNCEGCGAVTGG